MAEGGQHAPAEYQQAQENGGSGDPGAGFIGPQDRVGQRLEGGDSAPTTEEGLPLTEKDQPNIEGQEQPDQTEKKHKARCACMKASQQALKGSRPQNHNRLGVWL